MARTLHPTGDMRFGWCAGIALGMMAVTGWAQPAAAGPEQDARAIEAEALRRMRGGETEAAYLLAQEADELSSSVVSRWLVAIGADALGKHGEALAAYRGLLAEGSLPEVRAAGAMRRVEALEAELEVPRRTAEDDPSEKKPAPPEDEPEPPKPAPKPEPPPPPLPMPDPGPAPLEGEPKPGPTAIGLRVGGFVALAGTFASGGALAYYALASKTATSSSAGYVNGVYARRLIPVTAGLGAATLLLLPLGYLVDWDEHDGADARARRTPRVSFVPGPGDAGLGVDWRF